MLASGYQQHNGLIPWQLIQRALYAAHTTALHILLSGMRRFTPPILSIRHGIALTARGSARPSTRPSEDRRWAGAAPSSPLVTAAYVSAATWRVTPPSQ
jgi:hypothetical protein